MTDTQAILETNNLLGEDLEKVVKTSTGNKVRLVCNAVYRNGVACLKEATFVADCQVAPPHPETPNSRGITLRFAGSPNNIQALHRAFLTGDAELNIEGVKPLDI